MDNEQNRRDATIKGVIVPSRGMNVQAHKDDIIKEYQTPDQYGKSKTVDFQETRNTDTGEHYVNYWVY
jgi:hypothetical protein